MRKQEMRISPLQRQTIALRKAENLGAFHMCKAIQALLLCASFQLRQLEGMKDLAYMFSRAARGYLLLPVATVDTLSATVLVHGSREMSFDVMCRANDQTTLELLSN